MQKLSQTQKVIDPVIEKFAPKGEEGLHRWVLQMMAERSESYLDFTVSVEKYIKTFGQEAAA